jgi:hypothetical protein
VAEVAEPVSAAAEPVVAPVTPEPEAEQATAPPPAPPTAPEPAPAQETEPAPVEEELPTAVATGADMLAPVSDGVQPIVRMVERKTRGEVGGAASTSVGDSGRRVSATVDTVETASAAAGAVVAGAVRAVERTTKAATAVVTDAGQAVTAVAGQAVSTFTRTATRAVGAVARLEPPALTVISQARPGTVLPPPVYDPFSGPGGSSGGAHGPGPQPPQPELSRVGDGAPDSRPRGHAFALGLHVASAPAPRILSPPVSAEAELERGGRAGSAPHGKVPRNLSSAVGAAAGSAPSAFGFGLFAALGALLVLAAPGLGRRVSLAPALAGPEPFASPPEPPG